MRRYTHYDTRHRPRGDGSTGSQSARLAVSLAIVPATLAALSAPLLLVAGPLAAAAARLGRDATRRARRSPTPATDDDPRPRAAPGAD